MIWTAKLISKSENIDFAGRATYTYDVTDENGEVVLHYLTVSCFPSEREELVHAQVATLKAKYYENEDVEVGETIIINGD